MFKLDWGIMLTIVIAVVVANFISTGQAPKILKKKENADDQD